MDTTTIRIQRLSDDEHALINLLTHEERSQVLLEAARVKAEQVGRPRKDARGQTTETRT